MNKNLERFIGRDWLVLSAIILWVSLDFFILGIYSRVLVGDEGDSILPALLSMPHMDITRPLWNAFSVAGTDRLATTFAPDLWSTLFRFVPGWLAYQITRVFFVTVGVLGVYFLGRKKFALSREAGLFSALLTGLYLGHAHLYIMPIAFTPVVILALDHLLENLNAPKRWVIIGIVGFFFAISAYPQYLLLFAPVFFTLWYLFIGCLSDFRKPHIWQQWAVIVLFFVFVYVLRGQEILALFFNAPLSTRPDWAHYNLSITGATSQGLAIMRGALSPDRLLSVWPYFNLNTPMLAFYLSLVAAFTTKMRDPWLRRLLLLMVVCAFLVVFMPIIRTLLYDAVPVIRGFSINKLWGFTFVAVMPAAGLAYQIFKARLAADKLGKVGQGIQGWLRATPFILLLIVSVVEKGISSTREWITQGSYKQIFESPVIKNLAKSVKTRGEPVRVASFQMYDSYVNAYGLESPGGQVDMYSKRYGEFWNKIVEPSINDDLVRKDYLVSGSTLEFGHIFSKIDKVSERFFGGSFRLNLLSLANVGYILSRDQLLDPELKLINKDAPETPWSALSVREKIMASAADNFRGRTHLYVYENMAVLPRYFLAGQLQVLNNRAAVLDALSERSASALRKTAFVARDDWPKAATPQLYSTSGQIKLEKYGADEIAFSTQLAGPGLLVVTNSFSPFWTCRINGIWAKIFPIDATFWGVELPKGAKSVTFSYEPPY